MRNTHSRSVRGSRVLPRSGWALQNQLSTSDRRLLGFVAARLGVILCVIASKIASKPQQRWRSCTRSALVRCPSPDLPLALCREQLV